MQVTWYKVSKKKKKIHSYNIQISCTSCSDFIDFVPTTCKEVFISWLKDLPHLTWPGSSMKAVYFGLKTTRIGAFAPQHSYKDFLSLLDFKSGCSPRYRKSYAKKLKILTINVNQYFLDKITTSSELCKKITFWV